MIQAKDFRLGNIFSYHDHRGYVCDAELKAESILIAQNDIQLFRNTHCPYKITEGWLINFGFQKRENLQEFYISWHGLDNEKKELSIFKNIEGAWSVSVEGRFITVYLYVHEIQNLYRDLSRTDLVLNESGRQNMGK